jgi:hypothetical protein
MIFYIIIFLLAIIIAFGMLLFRVWEIKTNRKIVDENNLSLPELHFRHVEKNMLYLTKHVVQGLVLVVVKYWFISVIKTKKFVVENWPKVHKIIRRKHKKEIEDRPMSFAKRAVLESKFKIKRMKQKIREEIE